MNNMKKKIGNKNDYIDSPVGKKLHFKTSVTFEHDGTKSDTKMKRSRRYILLEVHPPIK